MFIDKKYKYYDPIISSYLYFIYVDKTVKYFSFNY